VAGEGDEPGDLAVVCHLDRLLAERAMTLTELADRVGITVVNLSVLKNGRARAVRFSTLTALCEVLGCQPGDLFTVRSRTGTTSAPATRRT
jgi:putative transcriptional regulator